MKIAVWRTERRNGGIWRSDDVDLCAQPLPPTGEQQVDEAIECLRRARDLLKASMNLRTLLKVRCALSSAKGARRIQTGRRVRAEITN